MKKKLSIKIKKIMLIKEYGKYYIVDMPQDILEDEFYRCIDLQLYGSDWK